MLSLPACVSLVFPGTDVRVEGKPRRGAGVASVTMGEEHPTGLWSGPGKPEEEERKTRAEQPRLRQLRGSPASLTSGGGILPGTERSVLSPGPHWTLWWMVKGLQMEGLRELTPEKKPRASPYGDLMLSLIHFVNTEFQAACQGQTYALCKWYLILTLTLEGRQYHWARFTARKIEFRESK